MPVMHHRRLHTQFKMLEDWSSNKVKSPEFFLRSCDKVKQDTKKKKKKKKKGFK